MIITNLQTQTNGPNQRFSVDLVFKSGKKQNLFFQVVGLGRRKLSVDYTPFLAAVLTMSMKKKEDIRVEGPVSERSLSGMREIIQIFARWNKNLSEIKISAAKPSKDTNKPSFMGSFFSGGVDSFATFLSNSKRISHLIFVKGFDKPMKNQDQNLFNELVNQYKTLVANEKVGLVIVETNLREIIDWTIDWDWGQGSGLASVALTLRSAFKEILIPGGEAARELYPYTQNVTSTHPLTDKLWSSEKLAIDYDGKEYTRLEKIEKFIAKSDLALSYLRVCWLQRNGSYNCGVCEKCLRTMIELKVAGALSRCKTFDTDIDIELVRKIRHTGYWTKLYFAECLETLKKRGDDQPLIKAIEQSLSRNLNVKDKMRAMLHHLDTSYNNDRLFWFLSHHGLLKA